MDKEYYKAMTDQCAQFIEDEWTDADQAEIKNATIEKRKVFLKHWFTCSFCHVQIEKCHVFNKKLSLE